MSLFIALIAGIAASLAFQAAYELRQRSLARARALGAPVERGGFNRRSLKKLAADLRLGAAAFLQERSPQSLMDALAAKLLSAELAWPAGKLALDMLLGALGGLFVGLVLEMGAYTLLAAALGLALPWMRVNDLAKKKELALRRELPDALDLLTSCVEAGLGFDQALARVASRLKPGPLRRELEATVASISTGASRREALKGLERRANLEELSQLVAALIQADKRGVPLGPALRAQSEQLRRLRTLRVKKLAAEAPLKMLFPLMAFILPVVFIVLFGPIILKWKAGGF